MTIRKYVLICALGLAVTACSGSSDDQKAAAPQTTAPTAQAPAHPTLSQSQVEAIDAAKPIPKQGTVLEMMHAAGYTYMQVDTGDGKPLWIAATMMRVQPQQKVQWSDAALMSNFTSKTLHRTFDKILFVSNAQVIE